MKHGLKTLARHSCLVALATVVVTSGCGGEAEVEEKAGIPAEPHPIVVVAVDGLRADALGSYGGSIATPNFDRLASESIQFQWAFAQAPEAPASLAAMLSGLYPTTSGVVTSGDRLPDEATTLAEATAAAGVTTAGFFEGAPDGDDYGLAQGFNQYVQKPVLGPAAMEWIGNHADDAFVFVFRGWSVGLDFAPGVEIEGVAQPEGFYDRLQEALISDFSDEPALLEPEDVEYVNALHANRIRTADQALGDMLAQLDGLGLSDRATLIVMGTTGMDLQQHGALGAVSLHSSVTRVPLFVRLPGAYGAGNVDKVVELIDLMPTVLDLAGVETPQGVQGASLVPIIDGAGRPPYIAFSETPHLGEQRAVAMGGVRMLTSMEDGTTTLYDLAADPNELTDVSESGADRVEVLSQHLEAWSKMVAVSSLDPERRTEEELDDETLERLKSLGYIQ
jgi:arylsulfatase A-like enzyme